MDVDRARHHDLAGGLISLVGAFARLRRGDAAVAHPYVADFVPAVGGIDDAAAGNARQHGHAPRSGNSAAMRVIASATEMMLLGWLAFTCTSVPVAGQYVTASWSSAG